MDQLINESHELGSVNGLFENKKKNDECETILFNKELICKFWYIQNEIE